MQHLRIELFSPNKLNLLTTNIGYSFLCHSFRISIKNNLTNQQNTTQCSINTMRVYLHNTNWEKINKKKLLFLHFEFSGCCGGCYYYCFMSVRLSAFVQKEQQQIVLRILKNSNEYFEPISERNETLLNTGQYNDIS